MNTRLPSRSEPLDLVAFREQLRVAHQRTELELRVLSLIMPVIKDHDAKPAGKKFLAALKAALPEYNSLIDGIGTGVFRTEYITVYGGDLGPYHSGKLTTTLHTTGSPLRIAHLATAKETMNRCDQLRAHRDVIQNALTNAEAIVQEHNSLLTLNKAWEAKIGAAAHYVFNGRS